MFEHKTTGRLLTVATYIIAIILFFPIFWMVLTSFKTEAIAFAFPPKLVFTPTLDNWRLALSDPFSKHLTNTVIIVGISTIAALVIGLPAAYSFAFYPTKRSDFTLMWMMSTRMLPPVGVIVPLFVIFRDLNLNDRHLGLILLYTAMNLPLVVWMMRSFLLDIPYETLEAARIDGATLLQEMRYIVLPLVRPGLMATALLSVIFAWNEFFFAFNLTASDAAPLSVFLSSFKTSEGLFWAKMSAAGTVAVLPVVIAGWVAQRQLVQGLTMGAVK
ncbi:MAG: carbohydrate ABC transporter permease [Chloroflexi bacterium]|nr:MAG: carbohydrate ABC transporter permease [Chloroflexota bacterium]